MKNLKIARKNANMTQKDVATQLNIPATTYANYEQNEKSLPPINILIEIANLFGCSVDYLVGHQSNNIIYNDFTRDQQKAISMIKKLNEKEVAMLLGYLARMTNTPLETLSEDKQEQKANF